MCLLLQNNKLGVSLDSSLNVSRHYIMICNTFKTVYMHRNQAYQFHTTPRHWNNPNPWPCLFSCPHTVGLFCNSTFRLPTVFARQTRKSSERSSKACWEIWPHSPYPSSSALATSTKIEYNWFSSVSGTSPQYLSAGIYDLHRTPNPLSRLV